MIAEKYITSTIGPHAHPLTEDPLTGDLAIKQEKSR